MDKKSFKTVGRNVFSAIIISILMCLASFASAQDFVVGGIAYNVLSTTENMVEVASKNNSNYSGNINVPATVAYGGVTYNVVALGEYAFYSATLSGITIPTSVTRIKYGCFMYATTPSSISIPSSVTEIEPLAFSAFGLKSINVDENNPNYRTIGGMLFSKDTSTLVECPMGKSGTITLPQNTLSIAGYAFANCTNITSISLNDGLRSIGPFAFRSSSSLNNVTIPSSVSYIGFNPFEFCTALTNISVASGNTHYYLDGYLLYSIGGDTLVSCHKSADSVMLPNTLRVVGGFGGNNNIKHVHIPDGVTTIRENAFNYSSLESVEMPGRMTLIDEYAFYSCEGLSRVVMPDTLDRMGVGCFSYCGGLESFEIPNGLRIVPKETFNGCYTLSLVKFGDDIEVIDAIAFVGCALEELTLPPSLRVIRNYAFAYLEESGLDQVVFSAPIDTIESGAFMGTSMGTLSLRNVVPPVTTNEGCLYEAYVDCIVIPCGSLGSYQTDGYWGQFADKYSEDCDGVGDVADSKMTVYPNPATNCLSVDGAKDCRYVEMVNQLGQTVLSRETVGNTVEIDVSRLVRGTYFLRLYHADGIVTKKVVLR